MKFVRRMLVSSVFAALAVAMFAGTALAAHDSNNEFDLAPGPAGPAGADGSGYSNYNSEADTWDSYVQVSGLAPGLYTFYAEGPDPDNEAVTSKTPVCVLEVMNEGQTQFCTAGNHAEPALATANVRAGNGDSNGDVVLTASGSTDDDAVVEDGEIERFPVGTDTTSAAPTALPDSGGPALLASAGGLLLLSGGVLGAFLLRRRYVS